MMTEFSFVVIPVRYFFKISQTK